MRKSIGILAAALLLGLTAGIANAAETKAVQTMAGIPYEPASFPQRLRQAGARGDYTGQISERG